MHHQQCSLEQFLVTNTLWQHELHAYGYSELRRSCETRVHLLIIGQMSTFVVQYSLFKLSILRLSALSCTLVFCFLTHSPYILLSHLPYIYWSVIYSLAFGCYFDRSLHYALNFKWVTPLYLHTLGENLCRTLFYWRSCEHYAIDQLYSVSG